MSSAWDGCQKYFYRSLARDTRLQAALSAPAKEIGLGSVDRSKGFTAHLLKLLIKQRSSLSALTEQWITMRILLGCMKEISSRLNDSKQYNVPFPPQRGVQQWAARLQHLAMQCIVTVEQFSWLIQCCPSEKQENCNESKRIEGQINANQNYQKEYGHASDQGLTTWELRYPSPVAAERLPPLCLMKKFDSTWQLLSTQVSEMQSDLKVAKAEVDKIRRQTCEPVFYCWKDYETCVTAVGALMKVCTFAENTEALFCFSDLESSSTSQQMSLSRSLQYIREEVRTTTKDFTAWKEQLFAAHPDKTKGKLKSDKYVEEFSKQVESAILTVLCATQSLVEKGSEKDQENATSSTEEVSEETAFMDILKPGHMTTLLSDGLTSDICSMQVPRIISTVSVLLEELKSYRDDCSAEKQKNVNQACCLLVRLIPMFSTYSDLILFYLTISLGTHRGTGKLVTVLTHLFTDLAQKGFCLPKDLMEEAAGEGSTEFHDYEGGGIGEGEGMKDVSDKIENEEQVEDSHRKGEEKEEKPDVKSDIKAEDNAIEMSEDFDGQMHDGDHDKTGDANEEEKSENEDEDLDKKMGDLGDAEADKLDERLWGDDEDDDSENENNDKMDETGPGMDEGDSELVAKDDNLDASSKNKNEKKHGKEEEHGDQGDEKESKEKIHEQMDEREYDENEKDPYQGDQEKPPETETLDLPNDLNLENEEDEKSKDKKEDGEEEAENPYEIEEKPMELDDASQDGGKEDENSSSDPNHDGEEGISEEKKEGETDMEKDSDVQEDEDQEPTRDNEEEKQPAEEDKKTELLKEDAFEGPHADQGHKPQEEEDVGKDEDLQESTDRMEHESSGQTADENVQNENAVELAGAASEKDQAKEEHGSGAADASQSEGHESRLMARLASKKQCISPTQSFKRKIGQADNERFLGDQNERVQKRLKTVESTGDFEKDNVQVEQKAEKADAYEHIKEGSKSYDTQTYENSDVYSNNHLSIKGNPRPDTSGKETYQGKLIF